MVVLTYRRIVCRKRTQARSSPQDPVAGSMQPQDRGIMWTLRPDLPKFRTQAEPFLGKRGASTEACRKNNALRTNYLTI